MIVSHSLRVIFLKTRKTAGSSFELALRTFCADEDEFFSLSNERGLEEKLGLSHESNILQRNLGAKRRFLSRGLYQHATALQVYNFVGSEIWNNYSKVSVHRKPIDLLVSAYFYLNQGNAYRPSFSRWIEDNYRAIIIGNHAIAPKAGPLALDHLLAYESLERDIERTECLPSGFLNRFQSIGAKSSFRPQKSSKAIDFMRQNGVGRGTIEKIEDLDYNLGKNPLVGSKIPLFAAYNSFLHRRRHKA